MAVYRGEVLPGRQGSGADRLFLPGRAVLALDFEAEEREQTAKITIGRVAKKRAAQLNGVDQPAASSLIGKFCAVVFSPDHLSLVKEGPSMRRKFLDAALCQRKPAYARLLSQYSRTLAQRNTLLKDISYHSELLETLEIWDEKLSGLGGGYYHRTKALS